MPAPQQRGFTLIELLITLAILGILIAIVLIFGGHSLVPYTRNRALQAETKIVMRAIVSYNSIEVLDGTGPAIEASAERAQIGPDAGPPFATYLTRKTQCFYTWDDEGDNLQAYLASD